jgi:hypothetical protein
LIEDSSELHSYTSNDIYSITVINDKCILLNAVYQLLVIDLNTFNEVYKKGIEDCIF